MEQYKIITLNGSMTGIRQVKFKNTLTDNQVDILCNELSIIKRATCYDNNGQYPRLQNNNLKFPKPEYFKIDTILFTKETTVIVEKALEKIEYMSSKIIRSIFLNKQNSI